jgi:hypothetical protein
MTVYIDDAFSYSGRSVMCRMVADKEKELHKLAEKIGLKRECFISNNRIPHYDVVKSLRDAAISAGAVPVTQMFIVERFGHYGVKK